MKLFISLDMEGMAGICCGAQEREDRELFRDALHRQLAWTVEGICASRRNAEITDITVADSHGAGISLLHDRVCALDERISLVSGSPRRQYMLGGLDESYALCFFLGYHAGAGTAFANMDHSYSGKAVYELRVNGVPMSEALCNAACAGEMGVPVGLIVGDSGLQNQLAAKGDMPWVKYVCTKEALSRYAVKYRPMEQIRRDTVAAVSAVLDGDIKAIPLYTALRPCLLTITFCRSSMADMVAQVPGAVREGARTVSIQCRDMKELLCGISALTALAGTAE